MSYATPRKPFISVLSVEPGQAETVTFSGYTTFLRINNYGPSDIGVTFDEADPLTIDGETSFEFPVDAVHVHELVIATSSGASTTTVEIIAGVV